LDNLFVALDTVGKANFEGFDFTNENLDFEVRFDSYKDYGYFGFEYLTPPLFRKPVPFLRSPFFSLNLEFFSRAWSFACTS